MKKKFKLPKDVREAFDQIDRVQPVMDFLKIPIDVVGCVNTVDLYNILMDEEKLKTIVSKLRNKAFW
jgi:hypothetical protein